MNQGCKAMRYERTLELNHEHGNRLHGMKKWILSVLTMAALASLMLAPCGCKPRSTVSLGEQKDTATPDTVSQDTSHPGSASREMKLPRLLDLGAHSCIPCKMMAPILDELKKEFAGVFRTEFIDVWKNPDAGTQYGIQAIPTQIFFDAEGKELFRHEGFFGKEDILTTWKKHGIDVEKP